jgi:hypothetical protein
VSDFLLEPEMIAIATIILKEIRLAESLLLSLDVPGQSGYVLLKQPFLNIMEDSSVISDTKIDQSIQKKEADGEKNEGKEGEKDGETGGKGEKEQDKADKLVHDSKGEFIDFVPRMFKQHEGQKFILFSSFDEAVDEYYCKVNRKHNPYPNPKLKPNF